MFGGVTSIAGALTFAELGSMMPQAGGLYVYLSRAYNGLVGFSPMRVQEPIEDAIKASHPIFSNLF